MGFCCAAPRRAVTTSWCRGVAVSCVLPTDVHIHTHYQFSVCAAARKGPSRASMRYGARWTRAALLTDGMEWMTCSCSCVMLDIARPFINQGLRGLAELGVFGTASCECFLYLKAVRSTEQLVNSWALQAVKTLRGVKCGREIRKKGENIKSRKN